jgi:aerobic carbon-monoxide dehydrogenase medium subunit
MVAAGANVMIRGPEGCREMPVAEVPSGSGRTNLRPSEILVSFTLPPRPSGSGDAYLRVIPRTEMDIAVAGCGVSLSCEGGVCVAARIALGAIAPTMNALHARREALVA